MHRRVCLVLALACLIGCDSNPGVQTPDSPAPMPGGQASAPPSDGGAPMAGAPAGGAPLGETENNGGDESGATQDGDEYAGEDQVGEGDMMNDIAAGEGEMQGEMIDEAMQEGEGEMLGESGEGGRPRRQPATLREMALAALLAGKLSEGLPLLRAHHLIDPNDEANYAAAGWFTLQRRPTQTITWAIGAEVEGRANGDDLKPAGSRQALPQRRRSPRRSRGGGEGDAGVEGAGEGEMLEEGDGADGAAGQPRGEYSDGELRRLTGDLGDALLQGLAERVSQGRFGAVLQQALNPEADPAGGESDGEEFAGEDAVAGQGESGGRGRGRLPPGVAVLGQGEDRNELLQRARDASADLLVFCNVKVSFNRQTGLISNNTTLELVDVPTGRTIPGSKTPVVNNVKVQQFQAGDSSEDEDPIATALEKLFGVIDEQAVIAPLPAGLQPVHVQQRLISLFQEKDEHNMLQMLDEVRLYHAKQLLPTEHLRIAFEKLVGPAEASRLLSGDARTRLEAIRGYLPATVVLPLQPPAN